jgi:phosphopantothenoylcysteine decarboxylase/phosphopantothenate--cysteine ligase
MAGTAVDPSVVSGKKVVLAVSGGIAAYKVVQVARDLTQMGADVRVVMTASAERFVGAQTFAALTGNPVGTEIFGVGAEVPHVELARGADLAIVAPATANVIAKMVAGMADDLLTATLLTTVAPILVIPAMHTEMWESPATEHNIGVLRERGYEILGPATGDLSSGDKGIGRMVEPELILEEAGHLLARSVDLAGKRLLITAGGTREPIDPVRYIGNHSSGRMGYVIAEEAARRGAKVTLVSGSTHLAPPPGVEVARASTAQEMHDVVMSHARDADVIIKAAAIADFRPERHAEAKIKKSRGAPEVKLIPTPDILRELGDNPELRKPGGILVGFAAETEPDVDVLARHAEEKRKDKGADVIVANQVGLVNPVGVVESGFEVGTTRAVIAGSDSTEQLGLLTKKALARVLLERIAILLRS